MNRVRTALSLRLEGHVPLGSLKRQPWRRFHSFNCLVTDASVDGAAVSLPQLFVFGVEDWKGTFLKR